MSLLLLPSPRRLMPRISSHMITTLPLAIFSRALPPRFPRQAAMPNSLTDPHLHLTHRHALPSASRATWGPQNVTNMETYQLDVTNSGNSNRKVENSYKMVVENTETSQTGKIINQKSQTVKDGNRTSHKARVTGRHTKRQSRDVTQ